MQCAKKNENVHSNLHKTLSWIDDDDDDDIMMSYRNDFANLYFRVTLRGKEIMRAHDSHISVRMVAILGKRFHFV